MSEDGTCRYDLCVCGGGVPCKMSVCVHVVRREVCVSIDARSTPQVHLKRVHNTWSYL